MSRQLTFTFEELPLLITGGFLAGLVNGQALINFWEDGQFGVVEIYLDGCRRKSPDELAREFKPGEMPKQWVDKPIALDRGTPLHTMIWDRLESEWRPYVLDAINNALEQERECA
jgi:hypothetical protein